MKLPLLVWTPLAVEAWAVRAGDRRLHVERTGMGPALARAAAARCAASALGDWARTRVAVSGSEPPPDRISRRILPRVLEGAAPPPVRFALQPR